MRTLISGDYIAAQVRSKSLMANPEYLPNVLGVLGTRADRRIAQCLEVWSLKMQVAAG
jgi:hypothetical protein